MNLNLLITPSSDLSAFIRDLWLIDHRHDSSYSTLPDGCPGIVIQLPTALIDSSGAQIPVAFVYGQTIQQRTFHTTAGTRTLGVVLEPGALRALLDLDAHILTDDCLDLSELLPADSDFLERMATRKKPTAQIAMLEDFLRRLLRKRRIYEEWRTLRTAYNLISEDAKLRSIAEIRSELGISERSLERRFRQRVGVSPRLYGRIVRFQSAMNYMRAGAADFTALAHNSHYSDQSHFIREFKEFAGTTPAKFRKTFLESVPNFVESRATKPGESLPHSESI